MRFAVCSHSALLLLVDVVFATEIHVIDAIDVVFLQPRPSPHSSHPTHVSDGVGLRILCSVCQFLLRC